MLSAGEVVMRNPLMLVGGNLVLVTREMADALGGHGNRNISFRGARSPACPQHKDERERAEQVKPPMH